MGVFPVQVKYIIKKSLSGLTKVFNSHSLDPLKKTPSGPSHILFYRAGVQTSANQTNSDLQLIN